MNRRNFIKNASIISAFTIIKPNLVFASKNNSSVKVGFIGCGARGSSVIRQMYNNTDMSVVALADIFKDKLTTGVNLVNEINKKKGFTKVDRESAYLGSEAYLRLLENKNVDAVLISTPAYTHPEIVEASYAAGKHIYCEKPAAIDAEGCKKIMKIGENLQDKLTAVTGFQIRYASPYVEMANRIKRGDIGEIISVQLYYFSSAIPKIPCNGMSNDECRIRNHFQYNELSGGIFLDQAIHMIDVCNWVLGTTPLYAVGIGGTKGRSGIGNSWTNYEVLYKYPNDINVSVHSTQIGGVFGDVCARFVGTKGIAEAHYSGGVYINGENKWDSGVARSAAEISSDKVTSGQFMSSLDDADKNKGKSFIESIQSGKYINQLRPGCESTLSAILGREAAIKEEKVTWEEIILLSNKINPDLNLEQFKEKKR